MQGMGKGQEKGGDVGTSSCPRCGGELEAPGRCVECGLYPVHLGSPVPIRGGALPPGALERILATIVRNLTNNEEN
jgi:hypothetical protein